MKVSPLEPVRATSTARHTAPWNFIKSRRAWQVAALPPGLAHLRFQAGGTWQGGHSVNSAVLEWWINRRP